MVLVYIGASLNNQLKNPLEDKLTFCSPAELAEIKVSHEEYCSLLGEIKDFEVVDEVTVISTCNRFELILNVKDECLDNAVLYEIRSYLERRLKSKFNLSLLTNGEAKLQFFRTYSGLNSGLVGEDEICAQIETSFRQAAAMKFIGANGIELLEDAIKIRKTLDESIYRNRISYCDVALNKSFLKFGMTDLSELKKIVILGSGNTTQQSALSLIGLGIEAEKITVVHRVSSTSQQLQKIKSYAGLSNMNFVRSKDHYRTDKAKKIMSEADLIIFGIDTKTPVAEFGSSIGIMQNPYIIDFNSNPSCIFAEAYDDSKYISNIEADSFVRNYSRKQIEDPNFIKKTEMAESFISKYISGEKTSLLEQQLVQLNTSIDHSSLGLLKLNNK